MTVICNEESGKTNNLLSFGNVNIMAFSHWHHLGQPSQTLGISAIRSRQHERTRVCTEMAVVASVWQPANSVVCGVNVPQPKYTSTAAGAIIKFKSSLGGLFRSSSGIVVIRPFGISSALKNYLPAAKRRRMQRTTPGTTRVAVGSPL